MDGFYSKADAANILGVSLRHITNYINQGKLRRTYNGKKVWIPHEDVRSLYENNKRSPVPSRDEFRTLDQRLKNVESALEIMKLGMGFGTRRSPRTEGELLLLQQELLDSLACPGWTTRQMSEIADLMMGMAEDDLHLLCEMKGATAWAPLFDLCNRMMIFTESHSHYPEKGLGTLYSRMERARDRLLGLIYVSSQARTKLPKREAKALREQLEVKPGAIDQFVTRYIYNRSVASKSEKT
jgi:hypothetical protein